MGTEILKKYISKDTRTIALMDEFERKDADGERIYDSMQLCGVFSIKYNRINYSIDLELKRRIQNTAIIPSGLTFTDLKKELLDRLFTLKNRDDFRVLHEVFSGAATISSVESKVGAVSYTFPIPVQFNAQNSSNRSGYGNRYYKDQLVHEGTLYGEVTHYMFTRATYRRWRY